ncbi:TetR/AcrR family transcriptional regulator [Leucobacter celer]|uniref:TetR/AcrR family transcriptional regulator n=1 Tax=Leucobacter celer TaxID=668625 RepID=UPI0006A77978|nr:TetR family transcriptional regulator [Leucobacter celer]
MSEPTRSTRKGSKNDPLRQQRIIEATARIIGSHGIDAVTFRSVAAEAGVPLGSTTYYFSDKDDLLVSTIHSLRETSDAHFRETLERLIPELGVAGGIAAMLEEITTDWRESLFEGYGVYVSTFSRKALRSEVADWTMVRLIEDYCPRSAARAIGLLLEGALTQVILGGDTVTAEEIRPAIEKLLELD